MKKLIFLLLAAAVLTGIVFADSPAYPPWGVSLEAVLPGGGADYCAVTQDTVPAAVSLYAGQPAGADRYDKYLRLVVLWGKQYSSGELSWDEYASLITAAFYVLRLAEPIDTGRFGADSAADSFYLRC